MTREEAIDLLDNLIGMVEDNQENDYDEALKMAIEALNVPDTNVGDTISRWAAIDATERESTRLGAYGYMDTKSIIDMLNDLPSAQRKGKWIRENIVLTSTPPQYQWHCSGCGRLVRGFSTEILTDFCPHCGAWMEGEEDGQLNIKTGCD